VTGTVEAVRCAALTYRFGDHPAVDHVDLEMQERPGSRLLPRLARQ